MSKKKTKKVKIQIENSDALSEILDAAITVAKYCRKHGPMGIPSLIGGIVMVADKADISFDLVKETFKAATHTMDAITAEREKQDAAVH